MQTQMTAADINEFLSSKSEVTVATWTNKDLSRRLVMAYDFLSQCYEIYENGLVLMITVRQERAINYWNSETY